ncbi:MyoD family inhibitor domain-containing protein [Apodemus speciosus]|uniref:MyoD family inhibitor domain-containing protein n=1 Tax=Apodemus speciosus TaxID=105296 RepID=A0ABQ0EU48_APOSI
MEACTEDSTEKDKRQAASSHSRCGLMRDQSIWRNPSDGELVRTQPERLPQLQTSAQEASEEETDRLKKGNLTGMSNGNGIHHGAKHASVDNHRTSAPVAQKMHRKIQSSLSVNNDITKKSKVNAVFSQKSASSPEDRF